jgi:aldose 1-epimerase
VTGLRSEPFGATDDGTAVERFVLGNSHIELSVLTWGATVQSLLVADRDGDRGDVVLGFDALTGYLGAHPYFGAVVGRFANRIAEGRFALDGQQFQIPVNDRGNALHGGPEGFNRQVWTARDVSAGGLPAVELTHVSPAGAMGFPGTLACTVTYTVDANDVRIDYRATTDAPTVVNLTQHSYFNLAGSAAGSIESHRLEIPADLFVAMDARSIPLPGTASVEASPFDFRNEKPIGRDIGTDDQQLAYGLGYDHSWILGDESPGDHVLSQRSVSQQSLNQQSLNEQSLDQGSPDEAGSLTRAALLAEAVSGRVLEVLTTEPAVQFYSGNQLDSTLTGKGGHVYAARDGLCLETQHLPDSPNRPDFPSVVLKPGETYRSTTVWRFSTD